jgi:hypothetical protein
MSVFSSAIDNTGHYHVRPRHVSLSPSCARSANNGHSYRSSCVVASLDLATRYARAVTKDSGYRLQRTCAESDAGVLGLVFFDRSWANDRARTAGSRLPTERWQDNRRKVRPGRMDEERSAAVRNVRVKGGRCFGGLWCKPHERGIVPGKLVERWTRRACRI